MKRVFSAILSVIICVLLLTSCNEPKTNEQKTNEACEHRWERTDNYNEYTAIDKCSMCGVTRKYIDTSNIHPSGEEKGLKMIRYSWDGYGTSSKEIVNCDLGYAIIECLSNLQETGAIIPRISDKNTLEPTGELPVERGTVWIECGSVGLFRLNPEMTDICKVETYFGEGKALQMTDTLDELLHQAWFYHPNDVWSGTYKDGNVSLQQLYRAGSAVDWVEIENIHVENEHHSKNNSITLSVKGKENKTVSVRLTSYASSDNLGSFETKEIELIADAKTNLEMNFAGFYNYHYYVSINIDNTRVDLTIYPGSDD